MMYLMWFPDFWVQYYQNVWMSDAKKFMRDFEDKIQ
jgi:hypothetical protein